MTAPATAQTSLDHSARNKREIIEIPVDSITPFPYQARRVFDEVTLAELAASIQSHGLINPITVQRSGETWTLIAGERRLRAVKLLGLDTIEAIVREDDDAARAMQASILSQGPVISASDAVHGRVAYAEDSCDLRAGHAFSAQSQNLLCILSSEFGAVVSLAGYASISSAPLLYHVLRIVLGRAEEQVIGSNAGRSEG